MGAAPAVALATCHHLPEPDPDEPLLVAALNDLGVRAEVVAWNAPDVNWGGFDLVVPRSTWDYHEPGQLPLFLQWCHAVSDGGHLANGPSTIRWNVDKAYLVELAADGIDVVPTVVATDPNDIGRAMRELADSPEVVIKPAVSAGSRNTHRVSALGPQPLPYLGTPHERMLVQPYLTSVEEHGERCLVFIEGEFTHAIRKQPRFSGHHESVSDALAASAAELALAQHVLDHVASQVPGGNDLLYARVDMTPDADGTPLLMELELIEPSLFLAQHPPALTAFAAAIAERARR